MNDHYGGIIHKDRMRTFYHEADNSRLASSARSERLPRPDKFFTGSRRRLAALVAAVLPTSGR